MADLKDRYFVVKKPDGKFFRGFDVSRDNALFETKEGAERFLQRKTRSAYRSMCIFAEYLSGEIENRAPQKDTDRTQGIYDLYRQQYEALTKFKVVEVKLVEV